MSHPNIAVEKDPIIDAYVLKDLDMKIKSCQC